MMDVDHSSLSAAIAAETVFYMIRYPDLFDSDVGRPWYFDHDSSSLRRLNAEVRTHLRSEGSLAGRPLFSITRTGISVARPDSRGRVTSKELR